VLTTLPVGTLQRLTISHDQGTFTCTARIIYIRGEMGMGTAHVDVPPDQLNILDGWLAVLTA
jgi:hypothetical protein